MWNKKHFFCNMLLNCLHSQIYITCFHCNHFSPLLNIFFILYSLSYYHILLYLFTKNLLTKLETWFVLDINNPKIYNLFFTNTFAIHILLNLANNRFSSPVIVEHLIWKDRKIIELQGKKFSFPHSCRFLILENLLYIYGKSFSFFFYFN